MKRILWSTLFLLILIGGIVIPAHAITFGKLDGDKHPNVGAIVLVDANGEKYLACSGTLISPTVFLTADHCVNWLPSAGIAPEDVWVTFDSIFSQDSIIYPATYYPYPGSWHDMGDPKHVAVLVLDEPIADITPAQLPSAGLLDQMKKDGTLKRQSFVAVGYGTVRDDKTGGFHSLYWDPSRRYVSQKFLSLTPSWLKISMNPATDNGGTCYGDSGGPHFLGSTSIVVSVTVTGDRYCRATDVTYRLDTPSARQFLSQFVTLP